MPAARPVADAAALRIDRRDACPGARFSRAAPFQAGLPRRFQAPAPAAAPLPAAASMRPSLIPGHPPGRGRARAAGRRAAASREPEPRSRGPAARRRSRARSWACRRRTFRSPAPRVPRRRRWRVRRRRRHASTPAPLSALTRPGGVAPPSSSSAARPVPVAPPASTPAPLFSAGPRCRRRRCLPVAPRPASRRWFGGGRRRGGSEDRRDRRARPRVRSDRKAVARDHRADRVGSGARARRGDHPRARRAPRQSLSRSRCGLGRHTATARRPIPRAGRRS